jgi:hypothetical protein
MTTMRTEQEIREAELDAERDAAAIALAVLLLMIARWRKRNSPRAEFRADLGRFYIDGSSVSVRTVRDYLQRIERRFGNRLAEMVKDLDAGKITIERFESSFMQTVRSAHILAGALAVGGIAAAVRNTDVRERIASELEYAENFVSAIAGATAGTLKMRIARARSYMRAATVTYGVTELKARGAVGRQTECRRIRRASESCQGCTELAGRWMPIAEMPPIGSQQCRGRCRCYLEFR